jgi:hypothetical protein
VPACKGDGTDGTRLVRLVGNGKVDAASAELHEMENALASDDPARRSACLDALDEMDAELDAWPKHHPMATPVLRSVLVDLIGPRVRQAWAALRSPPGSAS